MLLGFFLLFGAESDSWGKQKITELSSFPFSLRRERERWRIYTFTLLSSKQGSSSDHGDCWLNSFLFPPLVYNNKSAIVSLL